MELTQRSGASRTTVREALRELVREGVATLNPHRGVSVIELSQEDVDEIFGVRWVLETMAIEESSESTPEARDLLVATAETYAKGVGKREWDTLANADAEFHCQLVDLLAVPRLTGFERAQLIELRVALGMVDSRSIDFKAQADDHLAIARDVAAGKTARAVKRLHSHLNAAAERVAEVLPSTL
jgi:DNA-binding GntR family transcriptional regulator